MGKFLPVAVLGLALLALSAKRTRAADTPRPGPPGPKPPRPTPPRPPHPRPPKPKPPIYAKVDPRKAFEAATALKAYLIGGGNWGWRGKRSSQVAAAQKLLGVKADGIVGQNTRAAARRVGVTLPPPSQRRVV